MILCILYFFTILYIIICETALYIVKHTYQFYTFLLVLTGHNRNFLLRVMGQIQMQDCRFGFSVRLLRITRFRVRTGFRLTWIRFNFRLGGFKFRLVGSLSDRRVLQTTRFKFRLVGSISDRRVLQTTRFKFRLGGSNSDWEVQIQTLNVMLIHLKDVKCMFIGSKCDLKSKFAGIWDMG